MHLKISPNEEALRIGLLAKASTFRAGQVVQRISNGVVNDLNASDLSVADHLLAQALIAHASLATAAAWWADIQKIPVAAAMAALTDICLNLPTELEPVCVDLRTGEEME